MISVLLSGLLAGAQAVGLNILGYVTTKKFFERVLAKVAISILQRLVKFTTNTVDDDEVTKLAKHLQVPLGIKVKD
jgi:hypothetical protein